MSLDEKADSFDGKVETVHQAIIAPAVEERRLVRKLDMRILPVLSIVYLFACNSFSAIARTQNILTLRRLSRDLKQLFQSASDDLRTVSRIDD